MNIRRFVFVFFVLLSGAVLVSGQSSAAPTTGMDLSEVMGGDYFVPHTLEPQLSADEHTMYHGVASVVHVADPNPPKEQVRVPAPLALAQAGEFARATFSISYIAEGGTDKFGQTCLTYPEDAKAAFDAAASIWANTLASPVPITIKACWADLSSFGSILGFSGGGSTHRDFANAPLSNTWYTASLANALAGVDLDPNNADMHITYNKTFTWYLGTDGLTPADKYDFMSVVLHDICHGLNFGGSMTYSGGQGSWGSSGSPYIYDTFVKDGSGKSLINTGVYANPSTALGNALTSNDIWFHGNYAKTANGGSPVRIFAPSTWLPGSSYSHLDNTTFSGTVNKLMVSAISSGVSTHDPGPVTRGLLRDLGWSGGPVATTLHQPEGPYVVDSPTYVWAFVKDSTHYYLWVNGPSGNVIKKWYTAAEAQCDQDNGICLVTPGKQLALGNYEWWVQTYNDSGYGPWSAGLEFSLGLTALVSPSGSITNTTPVYMWKNLTFGSTWVHLYVSGPSGSAVIDRWYAAGEVCTGIFLDDSCSASPATTLPLGNYKWWVQTYNSNGYGPWSAALEFSLGVATLYSPSGSITDTTPAYTWSNVSGSTWYHLYVSGPSGSAVIDKWYTAADANCSGETCSVTSDTVLPFGNYKWWVQTYNSNGYGPWSAPLEFTAGKAKLYSPSGSINQAMPFFQWSYVPDATWYRLYVSGTSGSAVIDQWYPYPAAVQCDTDNDKDCGVTPGTALPSGNYKWWIQTYKEGGNGPWSLEMSFQVQ